MESDAEKARQVARVGSRFALLMLVAGIALGVLLTGLSSAQLAQVRRFGRQILAMRARSAATAFYVRYFRNLEGDPKRVPEIVDEEGIASPDYIEVYDETGAIVGTYRDDGIVLPALLDRQTLDRACEETLERFEKEIPFRPDGTARIRRALIGKAVRPASAGMREAGGRPVWEAVFALPSPASVAAEGPGGKGKGLVVDRAKLALARCTVVRVGVDATAQRSALRTHLAILGLAILSTLLVTGINIALLRTLRQREREAEDIGRAQRARTLGEMAATLAHELKNPVGAIRGYAQLMREARTGPGPEGERIRRAIETIERESTRLERLVQRTLEFASPGELALERIDLREVADAASSVLAGKASRAGVSIVTDHDVSAVEASADRDRIEQVVANILDNAIEASAGGGNVVVRATSAAAGPSIEIRDRGCGIDPGRIEDIFRPFHTTRPDGTGLGLAVARSIVEAHGGTLVAASEGEGKGAVFTVTLPGRDTARSGVHRKSV